MAYEYRTCVNPDHGLVIDFLEKGWEIATQYTKSYIENVNIAEEITQYIAVSNGSATYNNNLPQYKNKYVPVSKIDTVFIFKRKPEAKVLFGDKNESN